MILVYWWAFLALVGWLGLGCVAFALIGAAAGRVADRGHG